MDGNDKKFAYVWTILFHIALVIFLILFFSRWTPLVIYNLDDWIYMGSIRVPLPKWGGWEPSRIFPEVAMPLLTGRFAAWLIYPLAGDYIWSITLASAIIMSVMIICMCLCLYRFMVQKLNCSVLKALLLEAVFLASFFLMFRTRSGSKYLFYSADLCTAYFYTMSGILNAILMLTLWTPEDATQAFKKSGPVKKVLLVVLIYFAMFSNLFHSGITAVFCGVVILLDFIKEKSVVKSLTRNLLHVSIIVIWFIVMAFEYSGGRSGSFDLEINLAQSCRQFMTMIVAIAVSYKVIIIASVIEILWLLVARKDIGVLPVVIMGGILETLFLLLLNSKVLYMSRVEASWGTWYYLILFCVIVGSYVMEHIGNRMLPGLVILCVMIVLSWYPDGKFAISSTRNPDYQLCYDTGTYIVNSIMEADKAGQTDLTLKLPKSDKADEFTFVPTIGRTVSEALYMQGIIEHRISVSEEFDESLNERFLPE